MRNTVLYGTIAVLSLAIAACDQNTTSSNTPASGGTQTATQEPAPGSKNETLSSAKDAVAGTVGTVSAELTSSTKGFVEGASMGDMYEVEASKIALARGEADDLKKFAQAMIDAHTQTTNELKAALLRSKSAISMPVAFDTRHQSMLDDLKGAKAEDFDGRYIAQQQNAHQEALILMRGYAKGGDNAEVKIFADMTAPKIQMHLDMLKTIVDAHKNSQRRAENH
jgi:putative membrane protein